MPAACACATSLATVVDLPPPVVPSTARCRGSTPLWSDGTFTTIYDADGRPVTRNSPGGVSVSYSYDNNGNVTSQAGSGAEVSTATRTFGYDATNGLTCATVGSTASMRSAPGKFRRL